MSGPLAGAIASRLEQWRSSRVAERLWAKDGSLWQASGKQPDELAAWLGWLDLPEAMRARVGELQHLARDVRADGYRRAAVLGMGGSSLAPDLFAHLFAEESPNGGVELRVLDSTHPDVVRGFRSWAGAERTIFCVSSKSGTTTEPNAFHAAMAESAPALDFIAITDPGTTLAELARVQEFRAIVEGEPSVGGRYSALSVFGLVPAALAGIDLERLLDRAVAMAEACRRPTGENPGLALGAFMGEAARAGRDKLTILTSTRLAPFADWAEQLIAESTGKRGTGIVPVVREPIGPASAYGGDRAFVLLTMGGDGGELATLGAELEAAGHPVLRLDIGDAYDVGGEFVRWEVATAAAGMILEIDPFDQPNVQESKDATKDLLQAYRDRGSLPAPMPLVAGAELSAIADPAVLGDQPVSVEGALRQLLASLGEGDYFAILAYLPQETAQTEPLERARARIRDGLGNATTLGFGPRFLHSTGQLHKGGPQSGVFLQLTAEPHRDLPIPGWEESFGTLVAAQALGDLQSLQRRGRRVVQLHGRDAGALCGTVERMINEAIGGE